MYNGVLPQERVQAKSLVVRQVLPEVQQVASSQIDRDSERIENSMNITQPSLILDVLEWKSLKGHFDVFLNDTRVLSGLSDRTGMPMLNFSHNQTNTLRIVRLDKSPDIYRFKAILWNGPKQLETLRADLEPNVQSLFQLNHHDDHLVVTEIQKIIVVSTRKLKIEVWDDKLLDGDFISIYCNGVKLIDYEEVLKTPIVAEFTIDTNLKNIVTFVSEDEGKYGNNSARVRIYENNVPVDEFLFNTNLLRRAGLLIQYRETNQRDKN
jgi:hypothetical protein